MAKEENKKATDSENVEKKNALEEAQDILPRLEEQNRIMAENLARQEKLAAENMISGKSTAGQAPQKLDETPEEYAKRVMAGDA